MRYVVREGETRGAGRYMNRHGGWAAPSGERLVFISRLDAERWARQVRGRVVRLLSRDEVVARARENGRVHGLSQVLAWLVRLDGEPTRESLRRAVESMLANGYAKPEKR